MKYQDKVSLYNRIIGEMSLDFLYSNKGKNRTFSQFYHDYKQKNSVKKPKLFGCYKCYKSIVDNAVQVKLKGNPNPIKKGPMVINFHEKCLDALVGSYSKVKENVA